MNRNQPWINFFGLVFIIVVTYFVYTSVTDKGPGLHLNDAAISERVSAAYLDKNVNGETDKPLYAQSGLEEGSANIVTSIVVNYRAFDTLGEVIILFASAAGVGLLLAKRKRKPVHPVSEILTVAIPLINVIILVVGITIMVYGHLSPGGGFPGGAVVASGIILMGLTFKHKFNPAMYYVMESLAGLGILIVGMMGMVKGGVFFENFLPAGKVGDLLSAGTVMILYVLIGVKVAAEISGISARFVGEDIAEEVKKKPTKKEEKEVEAKPA